MLVSRRLSLTAALSVAFAAPVVAQPRMSAPGAPTTLTPQQQAARAIYKEMVEVNTVDSVGSVTKLVELLAKRFRDAGFPERQAAQKRIPGEGQHGERGGQKDGCCWSTGLARHGVRAASGKVLPSGESDPVSILRSVQMRQ